MTQPGSDVNVAFANALAGTPHRSSSVPFATPSTSSSRKRAVRGDEIGSSPLSSETSELHLSPAYGAPMRLSKSAPGPSTIMSMDAGLDRIKRRRTSPMESPIEGRAIVREGGDVWPPDVEAAFFEGRTLCLCPSACDHSHLTVFNSALHVIPKLGRRKVQSNGKSYGRNELIANYIFRKTNKIRSRKQVSSHIQVLKNVKRDDPECEPLGTICFMSIYLGS
jgi:hypothetical protein